MGTTHSFIVSVLVGTAAVSLVNGFQLPPVAACAVGMCAMLLNNYLTGRK